MEIFAEQAKAIEQAMNLQKRMEQHYSKELLEQMSRVADSINRSAQGLLSQNFSEVAKALNAFHQSERQRMAEAVKMSMSVLSSIPILQKSEYEEEQLRKSAEILRKVEIALEKLPPELQDAFWDTPLDKIPLSIVLDQNLTDERRAAELATFFAGGEIESAWMQIRRILYPHLVSLFVALDTISYVNTNFIGDNDFQKLLTVYYVILAIIYFLGAPPERSDSES